VTDERAGARGALEIRPARLAECAEIASLARALLPEAWSEAQLSSEVALPEGRVWVAREGGTLVAFLVARREQDELHVLLTGVAPGSRRQGAAGRLFAEVLAKEPGLVRAHLEVRESNAGAQAFYRAMGFRAVGRRPGHYPGGEAAVLMARELSPPG
jgi:ribosomal protein S18 acetylase RimI-like enzyme